MSHPRISAFAGSAKGHVAPVRALEGQATRLSRTMHQIALDTVNDEIVASNALAQAILFFRGSADGEEPPLRTIQGPRTKLHYTDNVEVDPKNDEVYTAQTYTDTVLVFDRKADGDVDPLRILRGPKTKLNRPSKLGIDPINNLLIVLNRTAGLLIFNRTDQGDVAPLANISYPGMRGSGPSRMALYPEGKKIFVSLNANEERTRERRIRSNSIGVWAYTTRGEIDGEPWALIKDTSDPDLAYGSVALNPQAKELLVHNKQIPPTLLVYHVPEVFE